MPKSAKVYVEQWLCGNNIVTRPPMKKRFVARDSPGKFRLRAGGAWLYRHDLSTRRPMKEILVALLQVLLGNPHATPIRIYMRIIPGVDAWFHIMCICGSPFLQGFSHDGDYYTHVHTCSLFFSHDRVINRFADGSVRISFLQAVRFEDGHVRVVPGSRSFMYVC